jgi:hypothetical protein
VNFSGNVAANTLKMSRSERARFDAYVATLAGPVVLTLEKREEIRSTQANRRYFVQCTAVAELLSVGRDVPISKDQAHHILASAFWGVVETPLGQVPKSTRRMPVARFNQYMDEIDAHFAAAGTPLPTMEPA